MTVCTNVSLFNTSLVKPSDLGERAAVPEIKFYKLVIDDDKEIVLSQDSIVYVN